MQFVIWIILIAFDYKYYSDMWPSKVCVLSKIVYGNSMSEEKITKNIITSETLS